MATILIVDDHVLNRQFLTALLGFDQHTLLQAADGAEALALVASARPALVITDILMPQMNGYEFVTRLRADPALAATPVIFYTSTYSTREASAMARTCGVRWVLQKPAAPDQILQTVREALDLPPSSLGPFVPPGPAAAPARLAVVDQQLSAYLQEVDAGRQLMSRLAVRTGGTPAAPARLLEIGQRFSHSLADLQTVSLRLTALIEMGIEMSSERDPLRLLNTGCRVARHVSVASYAVIGLLDADGVRLRHVAARGLDAGQQQALAALRPDSGVLGKLLGSRMPQRVQGLDGDPAALGLPPGHPPVHSFLGVPIASSGRSYGWIYLADKLGADAFSEVDEQTVATVATQLAVAYENLALYDEVQGHVAQLEQDLCERQRITDRLHDSEERFRQLAEHIDDVFFLIDPSGRNTLYISPAYEAVWGRSCASLYAHPHSWTESIHPDDLSGVQAHQAASAEAGGGPFEYEYRIIRPDGAIRWIHARGFPIRDPAGTVYRVAGIAADITRRRELELALREREAGHERLSRSYAVLSGINAAIVRLRERDALLQEACRVAVSVGGFSMAWAGVLDPASRDGRVAAAQACPPGYTAGIRFTAREHGPDSAGLASLAVRERKPLFCHALYNEAALLAQGHRAVAMLPLMVDKQVVALIALFSGDSDLFEQPGQRALLDELAGDLSYGLQFIDKEERLTYLACYDALTGLPNSMLFHDRLTQFLHTAGAAGEQVATVLLDLDRFAHFNDAFGRHAGDAMLKLVTQRLLGALVEPATLARVGGDIFALAWSGLHHGADAAALLEQQVLQALRQPFRLAGQELNVSLRAGIALYPGDGADAETLFKHAEVALKKAKSSAERYLYYAPQMNAAIAARVALERALREAIDGGQFVLHYQPRVDLASGRIVSAEALIRWQDPRRGLVGPLEFIQVAEETGQIVAIGEWVIDAVCAQQAAWQAAGVALVPVALNLSAVQFKRGTLCAIIDAAVRRHGLQQHWIEFELTESVVMEDPERATRELRQLKDLGSQLALDDFGTGYSSLAYLKRFPFDIVKIDRTFITDVTGNPDDAAIASAVIAMSHSLGLRVVAEGVETQGQLDFLRRHGCDEIQGYFFSRPVAAAGFEAMLRAGQRLAQAPGSP